MCACVLTPGKRVQCAPFTYREKTKALESSNTAMSNSSVIHTVFICACAPQSEHVMQVNRKVAFKALPFSYNVFNPLSLCLSR